jgi:hypothetical protein|tara:strand:+ start:574 stop:699 length:126 start_codon:yes stop_codon:yes gene_type:complete
MPKKKNIPNNYRGKEDLFFKKIKLGIEKFLAPPSYHIKAMK